MKCHDECAVVGMASRFSEEPHAAPAERVNDGSIVCFGVSLIVQVDDGGS
jgi:hypothetical protein